AQQGATVMLSDRNGASLKEAVQTLVRSGWKAAAFQADVTAEAEIEALVAGTASAFGGRLDILVNNAGLQHVALIEDFPTEKFELMLKVMLTAPFLTIKHALPLMKRQRYGRILN